MSEGMHSTLLPCPFCGDTDPSMAETGVFWLRCTSCTAEGAPFDTEAEAIAAWNTRAATSLHHELVNALEATLCELSHCATQLAARGLTGHKDDSVSRAQAAARAVLAKAKPLNLDEPRG